MMSPLSNSPLLAGGSHLDEPAVLGLRHPWTWRQIHQASIDLLPRFGDATSVCNLCTSRVGFLVTWLAALRGRRTLTLPPSGSLADLAVILTSTARTIVVADDPQVVPPGSRRADRCVIYRPEEPPEPSATSTLAWQPAWDEPSVLLYTSGSTGVPVAQPKSLRQLANGAQVLGARLARDVEGGLAAIRRIVCSVPPQHMFGVEGSVMLSLVHGMPVLDRRPLLPADVRAAFSEGAPAAWITTPLHLGSLVRSGERLPNCSVVIASTMPLAPTLAQQTEQLVAAPVLEIYGSTETGVLAMRRSARDELWEAVDGVQLECTDAETRASGKHFTSPVRLQDQIELDASGRFALLGRQTDLIKIAGRRASLAGLNLLLQELPGLEDGVFYLPAGSATNRLCLIHSGPPLDRGAVVRWLRARLDPVFLPRTLIHVDRLPRSDNGKLPRQALDQLFERWHASTRRPALAGFQFVVPADHPALAGHFPGRPIVPGVLLLDHVLARLAATVGRPVARLKQVRFMAPLLPDETADVDFSHAPGDDITFTVKTLRDGAPILLSNGRVLLVEPTTAHR
jgi:acyl-CoA synthetase (AMP-forming)/AMP-acid ligase II